MRIQDRPIQIQAWQSGPSAGALLWISVVALCCIGPLYVHDRLSAADRESAPRHNFTVTSRAPVQVECANPTQAAEWLSPVENWRAVYDLPAGDLPYIVLPGIVKRPGRPDEKIEATIHVHCPEERIGGGYREGKFVYLKEWQASQ